MNVKNITKLLAAILVFVLSFSNLAILGSYANVYASDEKNLEEQSTQISKTKIEFDAYFVEGESGSKVHSKVIGIDEENAKLNISLKVEDGYLNNGSISIANANFKVKEQEESSQMIQKIVSEENKIELNRINRDESVILEIPIEINTGSSLHAEDIAKTAMITINGTYTNNKGKETKIEKGIEVETVLDGEAEGEIEQEVTKYVPFSVNGSKGVILQTAIRSNLKENKLPVKTNKIEIEIPSLNKIEPKTITVTSRGTKATNGKDGEIFKEGENYKIESGKIELEIQNGEEEIAWEKDVKDEIIVTYIYDEEAIVDIADINLSAKSEITYYAKELKTAKSESKGRLELAEQIGDIVTTNIEANKDKIYKGYMVEKNGSDTTFEDIITANIGHSEIMDKLTIKDETSYIDERGNIYPSNAEYTYTKIDANNLEEILGEDGYINIYGENGEIIATLNKEVPEYKYTGEIANVIFETSKPETEGILKIQNGRKIKSAEYTREQIESFKAYRINAITNIIKDDTSIIRGNKQADITLENSKTQAGISINNQDLSTVVENENLEMRVVLKTTNETANLYKNPEIEIEMPNCVTDLNVENVQLLYENELKIKTATKYKNANGNQAIKIELEGEQTNFNSEAITEGATLVINAKLKANELTPTKTEQATMKIKNAKTGEEIEEKLGLNFIAPAGIATISQVSNYEETGKTITSISGKEETGELKTNAPARKATVSITAINNYQYGSQNVKILGRTPYAGNKKIVSGEDLGSTFTAKMVSEIKAGQKIDGTKIYYTANGEADQNLENAENGWTENYKEVSEIKSYMIVLEGYTFKTGEMLSFNYDIEIPANLGSNESTKGTFAVIYERASEEEANGQAKKMRAFSLARESIEEGPTFDISTGNVPDMKVELVSNIANGTEVGEREDIRYIAKVTNNGKVAVNNVYIVIEKSGSNLSISGDLDAGGTIIQVGTLQAGETKNIEFVVNTGSYNNGESDVKVKVTAVSRGYEDVQFASNEIVHKKVSNNENPKLSLNIVNPKKQAVPGDKLEYALQISTNVTTELKNVVLKCKIPEGLIFTDTIYDGQYNSSTRTVTWKFDKVEPYTLFALHANVDELPSGVYEKDLNLELEGTCDGSNETFKSKIHTVKVIGSGVKVTQKSNITGKYVRPNDELTYTVNLENLSTKPLSVAFYDFLSDDLQFVRYSFVSGGKNQVFDGTISSYIRQDISLDAGETKTIYVTTKVKDAKNNTEIKNIPYVVLNKQNIYGNEIVHTVIDGKEDNGNNGNSGNNGSNNPNTNYTYSISGTAWLDENKDGKRDDTEKKLSGIKTYLLNSSNNNIVKTTATDSNGAYSFADVTLGKYIVAFEYDTNKYDLTKYKVNGVDENHNSDAINMMLQLNKNALTKFGATNTIDVSGNVSNLDLGLIDNPKFDLELEKTVKLVQVSNSAGTKTYNFKDTDLAKVEIPEKQMKGSVIAITYSIKVKNTGGAAGYVNKIVDYKAKDLNFNSALNAEWYQDTDGNIYTTTMRGKVLNPGETAEVQLILTKTMSNENIGISNNTAEISEVSNDLGLKDIDSTPGNKNAKEDDFGSADVIVAVKTGGVIFYGGILLIVMAIFAFGAYEIKKRVIDRI